MPDCSSVTFHIELDDGLDGYTAEALADIGTDKLNGHDGEAYPWHGTVILEDYDSPWGYTNDSAQAVIDWCQRLQLPFTVYDSGHYTWDASRLGWAPGMPDTIETNCGTEGLPFLHAGDLARAAVMHPGDPAAQLEALAGHLSDDPRRWIPNN